MGMIIGTAAYMAPEQAKGKPVDKRADVWAFGAVLYEMLTGRKMFEAADVSEMLASSVLLRDPDISGIGGRVPAHIQSLLRRCLVKDPRDRLRDIGEVRIALEVRDAARAVSAGATTVQLRVWQRTVPALVGVGLGALVSALVVWSLMRQADAPTDVVRVTITLSESAPLGMSPLRKDLAISPGGTHIIYSGGGLWSQLYLRPLDQLDAVPLGGEVGTGAFFSADGEWVGFVVAPGRLLKKVPIIGGTPVDIAALPDVVRGGSWGADDEIIVGQATAGLFLVSAGGGAPRSLTTPDAERGETGHGWPSRIPDRQAVLFVAEAGEAVGQLAVLDLESAAVTRLGLVGTSPHYTHTGHLVYGREDESLWAVPFDRDRLEVTGTPVLLVERVVVKTNGAANFDVSTAGRLVYVGGAAGDLLEQSLVWVDRDGQQISLIADEPLLGNPRLSPDGSRLALTMADFDIWIRDLERGGTTRLTVEGRSLSPVWVEDGSRVAFASLRSSSYNLYSKAVDFGGEAELLLDSPLGLFPGSWSAEGATLVYHQVTTETNRDIGSLSADGPRPVLETDFNELALRLSPDGRWMAYISNHAVEERVYMQPSPDGGRIISISTGPGTEPVWSRDGRELFYRDGDRMMVVDVPPGLDPAIGRPRLLFEGAYATDPTGLGMPNYDVSLDGLQFVMIASVADDATRPQLVLVENWFEELKERVPIP
jgi:serine/threonine-protein kinase